MSIFHARHSSIGRSTHEAGTAGAHVEYIIRRRSCDTVIGEHMPLPPIGAKGPKAREWMDKQEASDRKNARVIDKLTLALPHELNAEQQVELVRNFANHVTRGKAPYLAAFHRNGKDAGNQHCHLILRDRHIETGKRVWGNETIKPTEIFRLVWETQCNKALERAGVDARVDRRSLKAQGIDDRDPTKHIGPTAQAIEAKGRESWKVEVIREEAEKRAEKRQRDAAEAEQAPETPEATPEAQRAPKSAPPAPDSALLARGDQNRTREAQSASKGDERTFEGKCLDEGLEAVLRASPGPRDAKTDFERAAILLTDGPDRLEDKWHDRAAAYRPNHQWPGNGPLIHEGQRAAWALSKLFQGAFTWADVPDGSRSAVRGMLERLTEWGRPLLDRAETLSQIATERMAKWRVMQVERVEWSEGLPAVHGHDHTTKAPLTARLANEAETAAHFVNARKFPDPAARERIAADMASVSRSLALRDVKPGATLRMVGLKEVRGDMIVRDFQPVDPKILPAPRSEPQPDRPSPQAQPRPDQSNGFKPR